MLISSSPDPFDLGASVENKLGKKSQEVSKRISYLPDATLLP